jgi:two-component system phosphate regulon response regulator PhoB
MREIVGKVLENLNQPKSNPTAEVPAPSNFKILIADDQPDNVHLLATRLQSEGYSFITAGDGQETLDKLRAELPDMVLLDVNMPKKSGFEVLAEMRDDPELLHIPVIVLTAARTSVRDIREGLGLGADDYITKPFSPRILLARVRTVLRRRQAEPPAGEALIKIHELVIDPGRHEAWVDGRSLNLTATEFRLLHMLAGRPGWVFTRTQIVKGVHGEDYPASDRSVDVQVVSLRKKLGACGKYLETVRGVGYRFKG